MSSRELWDRYREWLFDAAGLGFRLDVSRMDLPPDLPERMAPAMSRRLRRHGGAGARGDRQPRRGPHGRPLLAARARAGARRRDPRGDRARRWTACSTSPARVHRGELRPPRRSGSSGCWSIGIGGSALGPQFVADALGGARDRMTAALPRQHRPGRHRPRAGQARRRARADADRRHLQVRRHAGDPQRHAGGARRPTEPRGLEFGPHAVAVTAGGQQAGPVRRASNGCLERFPMWDWVGGRTSELCAVGLLPAALQGIDVARDARRRGGAWTG